MGKKKYHTKATPPLCHIVNGQQNLPLYSRSAAAKESHAAAHHPDSQQHCQQYSNGLNWNDLCEYPHHFVGSRASQGNGELQYRNHNASTEQLPQHRTPTKKRMSTIQPLSETPSPTTQRRSPMRSGNSRGGKRTNKERTPFGVLRLKQQGNIDQRNFSNQASQSQQQDVSASAITLFCDNQKSGEGPIIHKACTDAERTRTDAEHTSTVAEEIGKLRRKVFSGLSSDAEEALEDLIFAYMNKKMENGVITIKPRIKSRLVAKSYLPLPRKQAISDDEKHNMTTIKAKAKLVEKFLTLINQGASGLSDAILERLAQSRKLSLVPNNFEYLDIYDARAIQEAIGCSARAMQRLKSHIEKRVGFQMFPSCLLARLSELGKDKLEVVTVKEKLVITSTDTVKKERSFNYLQRPMYAFQILVESAKTVGKYRESSTLSSLSNTCIGTLNIDKGGIAINASVSCRNVENGNSGKETMIFATVDGGNGVCECHANLEQTFFNLKYPINKFILQFTGGKLWMLTVVLPSNDTSTKHYKTIIFESANEPKLNNSTFGYDFVIDTDNTYPPESGQVPSIDISVESVVVKLVKNDVNDCITGVQLSCDGNFVLAEKFCQPIKIDEMAVNSNFTAEMEKVIGFPVNDMKMQLTLIGVSSASCTYGCPACCSPRSRFSRYVSDSLLQTIQSFNHPCVSAFKSRNEMDDALRKDNLSPEKCWANNNELTKGLPYPKKKDLELISNECKSVTQVPLLKGHRPKDNSGDGLHIIMGLLNHFFDAIRKYLISIDSTTVLEAEAMLVELKMILNDIETSKKHVNFVGSNTGMKAKNDHVTSKNSKDMSSLITSVLRYSELKFLVDKTAPLKPPRHGKKFNEDELGWSDGVIDTKITKLRELIYSGLNDQIDNLDSAESTHHAQLLQGVRTLVDALTKFLSGSSKRAHGKLEYMFDFALQTIGGGSFSAEHGGREQTNGKAMISIENFDEIMDVCIYSLSDEPDEEHIVVKLELFKTAGKALFDLTKLMKQQTKLEPDVFNRATAWFLLNFEAAFPNTVYYNKLHFLASHVTEFVKEYHCYGLLSAEGHESKHASFAKQTALARYLGNNGKRFELMMSNEFTRKDPRVVKRTDEVATKGKLRGKYTVRNFTCWTTRVDNADQEKIVKHHGDQFFRLPGDTSIIPYRFKDMSLFLIEGTLLPGWKNEKLDKMMAEHSFRRSNCSRW